MENGTGPMRLEGEPERDKNHVERLRVADVLDMMTEVTAVHRDVSLNHAIEVLVIHRKGVLLVEGDDGDVLGIFTTRDVLQQIVQFPDRSMALCTSVHEIMTPASRIVYCTPADTVKHVRLLMRSLGVRNVPVVDEHGVVRGIMTAKLAADHSSFFRAKDVGGKAAFMQHIEGHRGLPMGTKLSSDQGLQSFSTLPNDVTSVIDADDEEAIDEYLSVLQKREQAQGRKLLPLRRRRLDLHVGLAALPHPFKRPDGVANTRRDYGPGEEVCTDVRLSEDSHFMSRVRWPTPFSDFVTYVGVADGVGSWRLRGVDPRDFSQRLMHCCAKYLNSSAPEESLSNTDEYTPHPSPLEVLQRAWEMVTREKIVGSCTACIVTLDHQMSQLSYANLGDSGLIILRHIDSEVAGTVYRNRTTPRSDRTSDLRIAFLSQQQLRSFNLPYQLGYVGDEGGRGQVFEEPTDANVTGYSTRPGDIVIVATDGLFDNVELDEICSLAFEWETKWFGGANEGKALPGDDSTETEALNDLAKTLCDRSREFSLDNSRDSPFAILAKDNDILWSGGMPDDCTVLALRVVEGDLIDTQGRSPGAGTGN